MTVQTKTAVIDVECYANYFLVALKSLETGAVLTFEKTRDTDLDGRKLIAVLQQCKTVGFNTRGYDLPLIWIAVLTGATTDELKALSDRIILGGAKSWELEREYDIRPPKIDHVDLIEVAPGQASLKIYGGRLHAPRMQDLPIEPDAELTQEEIDVTRCYCVNDLDTTILLAQSLKAQLDLRETMSKEYGQDLRSKSDAQIAEAVIRGELERMLGGKIERPRVPPGTSYKYKVPSFIRYRTPVLQAILAQVEKANFKVMPNGSVEMPKELESAKIAMGGSVYRMGIGGLHSSEKKVAHVADGSFILVDRDVASYYPAIILNLDLAPRHLGQPFLDVYRGIVDRRLTAKRLKDTVSANTLKIVVNGSFGKLGSMWSVLYSPDLMIQVTVTGQLSLLLLIETLELAGIPVVSANTDGVVIKCPTRRQDDMNRIIAEWERVTGFETEETQYKAVYSRDVNNYLAIKTDGKHKAKGAFADPGLQKNPANQIAITAAVEFLKHGTPIEDTIYGCDDIRQFVTIRTVKGGAVKDDVYLGKAIRWYYAKGVAGTINYKSNGNKVPRSDGAKPCMVLPEVFPDDVDHAWYVAEARSILQDVGYKAAETLNDDARKWLVASLFMF